MHRHLWNESYTDSKPPLWPCPACGRETLQPISKSLSVRVPTAYELSDLPDDEYTYRFQQFFQCSVRECGDIVCISGDASLERNPYSMSSEDAYFYQLSPKAVHRGMPIISLPPETPETVRSELQTAFSLFWQDLGSCANKMRISVERALDELGIVPASTLNERIKSFEAIDPDHGQTFHALREVGNVGSHQGDNTRETILDAWEIYEDALRNLFGGHKDRIDALKKKIRSSRGK